MTNPNDAIGVNAAYGTRTSTNAFNDICQLVNGRGVLSGWSVVPKTGMTVEVGGVAGTRDVAIGEDNLGNRITFNNRIATAVDVEIAAASASANRYDAIVLYAKNPAIVTAASPIPQDAPSVCGIIDVQGDSLGVSDAQIRAAITADGGAGTNAYYVVLATIYVAQGTTTIAAGNISMQTASIGKDLFQQAPSINASYIKLGKLLIQYGQVNGGNHATSDGTINLPMPFADTNYTVVTTNELAETGSTFWWSFVISKTTSSFNYRLGFKFLTSALGGGDANNTLNWIAIGLAPN